MDPSGILETSQPITELCFLQQCISRWIIFLMEDQYAEQMSTFQSETTQIDAGILQDALKCDLKSPPNGYSETLIFQK